MKFILLTLIICFWYADVCLYGQTYRGKVYDSADKKPVEGMTFCLLRQDSLTIAFTNSNEKGEFELTVPEGARAVYLLGSMLGYKKIFMSLNTYKNHSILLAESTVFKLKEVKVTAQRIIEKEDTLIYSVSGFSMPQDRSIADVIKKMPGMEVKPNGVITYNGTVISKFYIEGMDLLGSRYAMASSNLSKKNVKEVQVLRNHQAVHTLKNKVFSDQAALNLVLTEDAKMRFLGIAEVGLGTGLETKPDFLYNDRLMGMMFGAKHQNLSIYKNDNTGKDLLKEIAPLTRKDLIKGGYADIEQDMIASIYLETPALDRERYIFNRSQLIATNHLVRTKHKNDIRTQVSFLQDKNQSDNRLETLYLFSGDNKLVSEDNSLTDKLNEIDVSVNVEANKETYYMNNRIEMVGEFSQSKGMTLVNGINTSLRAKPGKHHFVEDFDFIRPLKNGRIFSVSSIHTYNYLPQHLLIFSGNTENVTLHSFGSHTFTYFQHKLGGMYIKYQAGLKVKIQSLSLSGITDENRKNDFTLCQPYLEPTISYKNYAVDLKLKVRLSYAYVRFCGKENTGRQRENLFMPEPSISFDYKLNGCWNVNAYYSYFYNLADGRELNRNLIFTSYRTATVNNLDFYKDDSHLAVLQFKYSHPVKGAFFSLNASYSPTFKHVVYERLIGEEGMDENVVVRRALPIKYRRDMSSVTARVGKSFAAWKSTLSLEGTYNQVKDALISDKKLQKFSLDTYALLFNFSALPSKYFSFEGSSAWDYSLLDYSATANSVHSFEHDLSLNVMPGKHWQISCNAAFYHATDPTVKPSFFLDILAAYKWGKWEIQLGVNNLIGKDYFERKVVSSLQETYLSYRIRPREMLGKVFFSF